MFAVDIVSNAFSLYHALPERLIHLYANVIVNDILKCIFFEENTRMSINIPLILFY